MKSINPLLAVLFTTAVGALPSLHEPRQHNCTNRNPTFTLESIYYDYYQLYDSPTHLYSQEATISFTLSNTAVQYKTQCSATVSTMDFRANITYQCGTPSNVTARSSASFTLTGRTGLYGVNQTWVCGNETFLGYGTKEVTLWDCQAKTTENYKWIIGETYNTTEIECPPVDVEINPIVLVL